MKSLDTLQVVKTIYVQQFLSRLDVITTIFHWDYLRPFWQRGDVMYSVGYIGQPTNVGQCVIQGIAKQIRGKKTSSRIPTAHDKIENLGVHLFIDDVLVPLKCWRKLDANIIAPSRGSSTIDIDGNKPYKRGFTFGIVIGKDDTASLRFCNTVDKVLISTSNDSALQFVQCRDFIKWLHRRLE